MRDAVERRLVTICHVWPGITPFNVWDLKWRTWRQFAAAADQWESDRKEAAKLHG